MTNQDKSAQFMTLASQEVLTQPIANATAHTKRLRVLLLLEEVLELAEAAGVEIQARHDGKLLGTQDFNFSTNDKFDIVEVADALGDILYVTYGAGNSFGLNLNEIYEAIHQSNLSKFIDGHRDEGTGKWIKGPSYTPVNLQPVIFKQSE